MFQHEGPSRSERNNRILAGFLALIGGFVNSAGFVLLGTFTSHVTGNVGRFANEVATGEAHAAWRVGLLVGAFFVGAMVASIVLESAAFSQRAFAYAAALGLEAALLFVFCLLFETRGGPVARLHDAEAAVVCGAMGLQNALVTRLSGAIVRTTHLTGVLTDLGIEAGRWARWARSAASQRLGVALVLSPQARPSAAKVGLLATIAIAFSGGAVLGAVGATRLHDLAILFPVAALLLAAIYAVVTGRRAPA